MNDYADFVAKLKEHLRLQSDVFLEYDNYACGDTESGFGGGYVFSHDSLDAEIDRFAASFVEVKK